LRRRPRRSPLARARTRSGDRPGDRANRLHLVRRARPRGPALALRSGSPDPAALGGRLFGLCLGAVERAEEAAVRAFEAARARTRGRLEQLRLERLRAVRADDFVALGHGAKLAKGSASGRKVQALEQLARAGGEACGEVGVLLAEPPVLRVDLDQAPAAV